MIIRKTPKPSQDEITFKLPLRDIIRSKFMGDSADMITIDPSTVEWWEGLLAGASVDRKDRADLAKVVEILQSGNSIDVWIEY